MNSLTQAERVTMRAVMSSLEPRRLLSGTLDTTFDDVAGLGPAFGGQQLVLLDQQYPTRMLRDVVALASDANDVTYAATDANRLQLGGVDPSGTIITALDSAGAPVSSFGTNGSTFIKLGPDFNTDDVFDVDTSQEAGNSFAYIVGVTEVPDPGDTSAAGSFAVAKLDAQGVNDTSYLANTRAAGITIRNAAEPPPPLTGRFKFTNGTVRPNSSGEVFVGGDLEQTLGAVGGQLNEGVLAKLTPNGSLDTSFGAGTTAAGALFFDRDSVVTFEPGVNATTLNDIELSVTSNSSVSVLLQEFVDNPSVVNPPVNQIDESIAWSVFNFDDSGTPTSTSPFAQVTANDIVSDLSLTLASGDSFTFNGGGLIDKVDGGGLAMAGSFFVDSTIPGGGSLNYTTVGTFVARFDTNGTLDTSFGGDGLVVFTESKPAVLAEELDRLGRLTAFDTFLNDAGQLRMVLSGDEVVGIDFGGLDEVPTVQLLGDGTLDPNFGVSGRVDDVIVRETEDEAIEEFGSINPNLSTLVTPTAVAVDSNNRVIFAGTGGYGPAGQNSGDGLFVTRLDNDAPLAPLTADLTFEFEQRHAVTVTFNRAIDSASLVLSYLVVTDVDATVILPSSDFTLTVAPDGLSAEFVYTANSGILPDANYEAVLASGSVDGDVGGSLSQDASVSFFFLQGDFNRDRVVDLVDFGIVRDNFGATGMPPFSQGDADYDDDVDLADFGILNASFGNSLAAPPMTDEQSLFA
ncbi:MAG: hypothetical protein AAF561_05630 [Planctomycetota bacterium]